MRSMRVVHPINPTHPTPGEDIHHAVISCVVIITDICKMRQLKNQKCDVAARLLIPVMYRLEGYSDYLSQTRKTQRGHLPLQLK